MPLSFETDLSHKYDMDRLLISAGLPGLIGLGGLAATHTDRLNPRREAYAQRVMGDLDLAKFDPVAASEAEFAEVVDKVRRASKPVEVVPKGVALHKLKDGLVAYSPEDNLKKVLGVSRDRVGSIASASHALKGNKALQALGLLGLLTSGASSSILKDPDSALTGVGLGSAAALPYLYQQAKGTRGAWNFLKSNQLPGRAVPAWRAALLASSLLTPAALLAYRKQQGDFDSPIKKFFS